MLTYCRRIGVSLESMRFYFDGERIKGTDTPSNLEMEDGDFMDVFQESFGGGLWCDCIVLMR